jgi:hypothetical protein
MIILTGGFQTPGGDEGGEGHLDTYALTREFKRMKKVINAQAAEIKRLRNKFRRLKRFVWPLVQNHRLWVKQKMRSAKISKKASKSKKSKKRSSSFILERNQNDNLNKDDVVPQDQNEEAQAMDFEDIAQSSAD